MTAVKPTERIAREAKEGEREARDKSHTKCRLPPKQLVCNQRQSSHLSGQFDFHLSNEALIFGLITAPAKLKLAARQSADNTELCLRLCEQPLLLLHWSPHPFSPVEDEKGGNEGGRERKRANLSHNQRRLRRQKRPKNEGEEERRGSHVLVIRRKAGGGGIRGGGVQES